MKRVTSLFDDERLYRQLKTEAAKEGRPVKDVVAEALGDWLRGRTALAQEDRERRQRALDAADVLRRTQPLQPATENLLAEVREERAGDPS